MHEDNAQRERRPRALSRQERQALVYRKIEEELGLYDPLPATRGDPEAFELFE